MDKLDPPRRCIENKGQQNEIKKTDKRKKKVTKK